jgi:fructose/tagatose bisphosphate aldolase
MSDNQQMEPWQSMFLVFCAISLSGTHTTGLCRSHIKAATGIFMTLHGGSGTRDEDFQQAIKAGMTIVHVNTELRLAWRRGLEKVLQANPGEVAPYKLLRK